MSLRFNSCGNVDCTCSNHTKVPEYSMSDQVRANTKPLRKLAPQSEAPSVDSQIDEVFDWLLALYIDADDAYMVEEMEEDRPIFRAKINRLIAGAEENGILKGLYQARYATEPGSEEEQRIDNQIAELSNNLSKGKDNEG